MKNHLLTLLFSLGAAWAFSQEPIKRLTLYDFGITSGLQISPGLELSKADWQILVPDAPDPTETDTGFVSSYGNGIRSVNGNPLYGAQVQFKLNPAPGSKRKGTLLIGFNIGYSDCISATTSYFRSRTVVADTLTSSQTGQQYYVMSDTVESYYNRYSSDRLTIGGSFLISTNADRIVSAFVGGQVQLGFSLARTAEYGYYKAVYNWQTNQFGYGNGQEYGESSITSRTTNVTTHVGVLIPFGVTFRLAKEGVFSHLSATWEMLRACTGHVCRSCERSAIIPFRQAFV